MENREWSTIKACIIISHGVSLCFISLPDLRALWVTFKAKNNVKIPLLPLHFPKSCTKVIMHVPKIVTYAAVEKRNEAQRTKINFGRIMTQVLELMQLAKHILEQSNAKQYKPPACMLGSYRITLKH